MYYIDLNKTKLSVTEYPTDAIKRDLKHFKKKNVSDLDDPTFRIFELKLDAENFISQYEKILKSLDNGKICLDRKLSCLLYKRKFIVQSLMKKKMCTIRHYFKDFKKDQLINLHDQTFFLTVKIKSVEKLQNGNFQYNFDLP